MPLYEFRCENGHILEVRLGFEDKKPDTCPECGVKLSRVWSVPVVKLKGGGWCSTGKCTLNSEEE